MREEDVTAALCSTGRVPKARSQKPRSRGKSGKLLSLPQYHSIIKLFCLFKRIQTSHSGDLHHLSRSVTSLETFDTQLNFPFCPRQLCVSSWRQGIGVIGELVTELFVSPISAIPPGADLSCPIPRYFSLSSSSGGPSPATAPAFPLGGPLQPVWRTPGAPRGRFRRLIYLFH